MLAVRAVLGEMLLGILATQHLPAEIDEYLFDVCYQPVNTCLVKLGEKIILRVLALAS